MKRFLFLLSFAICSLCMTATAQPYFYNKVVSKKSVSIGQTTNAGAHSATWLDIGDDTTHQGIGMPCVVDTSNITGTKRKGMIAYFLKYSGIGTYNGTKWILPLNTKTIAASGVVDSFWIGFTHGLTWTPTVYGITSTSSIAKAVTYWSADSAKIYVHFRDTIKSTASQSFNFTYR